VVEIRGPQNLVFLKALGSVVERRLMESSVLSLGPSSTAPGSSTVISPSAKFYSSRMTSCVANLPAISNKNIASVHVPSLIGASTSGKGALVSSAIKSVPLRHTSHPTQSRIYSRIRWL